MNTTELPPYMAGHQLVRFSDKNKTEAIDALDEEALARQSELDALKDGGYDSEEDHVVAELNEAEAITSWDTSAEGPLIYGGSYDFWDDRTHGDASREQMHRVVLDIDIPAVLIPSTTPGHSHLYIDKLMTWSQYGAILTALANAGIIEQGFAEASLTRGYSAVRLPWVKKPESEMVASASPRSVTGCA